MKLVPLDSVVDLLQVTHAATTVRRYRDRMRCGDLFPPVSVLRIGRWWVLADGHKRLSAARPLLGRGSQQQILVEVWPWTRFLEDQWRQAVRRARLNARMLLALPQNPRESWAILRSSLLHWRRVVASLKRVALGK